MKLVTSGFPDVFNS